MALALVPNRSEERRLRRQRNTLLKCCKKALAEIERLGGNDNDKELGENRVTKMLRQEIRKASKP
jgi:hypothetical protein